MVVVGGGIAGMEAALDATKKGYKVEVYEATNELGGAFISASSMSFKKEDKKLIQWYIRECKEAWCYIPYEYSCYKRIVRFDHV
ncbi:FAD-dependent oxidoreductase [Coprobacillaceae bacterium CR2/5/TPMF4]|nr:FAD-dependent oxidoreductase [Coprobacillaceae bacterium CR2/5/TPMF4]